jgi:hypothetical protein
VIRHKIESYRLLSKMPAILAQPRRANQGHYSTIAQFVKRPWPFPTTASSARLQAKSLPTIEVAAARYGE